jgi:TPR repeat protein
MNALGIAYRLGEGVVKNNAAAYAHFKLSMEFGAKAAEANLNQLLTLISDGDRTAGENLLLKLRSEISTLPSDK